MRKYSLTSHCPVAQSRIAVWEAFWPVCLSGNDGKKLKAFWKDFYFY
jgi:hypothetical protein